VALHYPCQVFTRSLTGRVLLKTSRLKKPTYEMGRRRSLSSQRRSGISTRSISTWSKTLTSLASLSTKTSSQGRCRPQKQRICNNWVNRPSLSLYRHQLPPHRGNKTTCPPGCKEVNKMARRQFPALSAWETNLSKLVSLNHCQT